MYIRIVTFRLHGLTDDQYEHQAVGIAGSFAAWPGLRAKFWLADRPRGLFGGVYVFDSKTDAERSRSTPLFIGMATNPAFVELSIQEFDTLTEPTSISSAACSTDA